MRLKECSTNYHASSLRRRNARQDKPADSPVRPSRGKKDRRRWCRGHVGREHKPVCLKYGDVKQTMEIGGKKIFDDWRVLACSACGKELDTWHGSTGFVSRPKPAWVTE